MAIWASIPCAAHVPPRCKVVLKSRKCMPAGIFCSNPCTMSNKALKAMQKTRSAALRLCPKSLENIAKTVVLLHEEHFCDACVLTRKNIVKCGFEGFETGPGRSQIEAGATPSPQKTTNVSQKGARNGQEPAKSEKKMPKREKWANMEPTWLGFDLVFGRFWLPLVRTCST